MDSTIYQNIAFGENVDNINIRKIHDCIKLSCLDYDFKKYNLNINSRVGERGVKLSGGQIQRIGLARAFYQDREILILDEATNALDLNTERKIYNNLNALKNIKVTFIITHSSSSLKICNKVLDFQTLGKINIKIN